MEPGVLALAFVENIFIQNLFDGVVIFINLFLFFLRLNTHQINSIDKARE
jgi:hypothetical protein